MLDGLISVEEVQTCFGICEKLIIKDKLFTLIKEVDPEFLQSKTDTKQTYMDIIFKLLLDESKSPATCRVIRAESERILFEKGKYLIYEKTTLASDETKKRIIEMFANNDISLEDYKFSIMCPITSTRMLIPARGKECTHLQCFDRDTYLKMNYSATLKKWKCPICNNSVKPEHLIVDGYFSCVLKTVPADVHNIRFSSKGGWIPIHAEPESVEHPVYTINSSPEKSHPSTPAKHEEHATLGTGPSTSISKGISENVNVLRASNPLASKSATPVSRTRSSSESNGPF